MRIIFIGREYFAPRDDSWTIPTHAHGGFGYLTRQRAEALAKMGNEVHVFIPRHSYDGISNKSMVKNIKGVELHLFRTSFNEFDYNFDYQVIRKFQRGIDLLWQYGKALKQIKDLQPDVIISEDPDFISYKSTKLGFPHLLDFQDPFDDIDFMVMTRAISDFFSETETRGFLTESEVREENYRKAGSYYSTGDYLKRYFGKYVSSEPRENLVTEANFISEKVKHIFDLSFSPGVIRNPVDVPSGPFKKSDRPSVLFLARWDMQKRPDIALEVAKNTPEYDFYFVGTSSLYPKLIENQKKLEKAYSKFSNIHILRFTTDETKREILSKSWVLLNTSVREGLPVSFLEAGSYETAILSSVDPDGYSSLFGKYVKNGDFKTSLRSIIESEECFEMGRKARSYMIAHHETSHVIKELLSYIEKLV